MLFGGRSSKIPMLFVQGDEAQHVHTRIGLILVFEVRRSANLSLCGLFDAIRECLVGTLVGQ